MTARIVTKAATNPRRLASEYRPALGQGAYATDWLRFGCRESLLLGRWGREGSECRVSLRLPALMTLPCPRRTIHAGNMAKSSPDRTVLKKQPPDLFVHARELLVEANRLDATKAHTAPPSGAACTAINNLG